MISLINEDKLRLMFIVPCINTVIYFCVEIILPGGDATK